MCPAALAFVVLVAACRWNPPQNELPGFAQQHALAVIEAVCLIAGCESIFNYNTTRMPTITSQFPSGTSVQNLLHWQQMLRQQVFQMFNYGKWGNLQVRRLLSLSQCTNKQPTHQRDRTVVVALRLGLPAAVQPHQRQGADRHHLWWP